MSAALALPTAAHATDPVPLEGAYVVDYVGVIGNQSDAVMGSLDSLADAGINLFVVVVDRFTGVGTNDSWAAATADLNRMGDRDVLFAIATVDRNFDFSYPDDLSLSEAETDRLENDVAVPLLRNNDYVGAIIAYADAMRAELTGTPVGPSDAGGGGIPINWPIVGGVVAVGGGALYLYSRSRKKKAVAADKLSQKELDTRAGVLLVQLDDQLKTSEQDLSFALAEFGETAVRPFRAALDSAQAKLREAFEIKQKLEDAYPEPPDEKRSLTLKIVELCESADAELDAQADAFDKLRELEKNAPAVLEAAKTNAAAAATRLSAVQAQLERLEASYSAAALAPVAANPAQAKDLVDFAQQHINDADAALASGDSATAAVAVHTAQASLGQVTQLLDAVDGMEKTLTETMTALGAVIADTEQDLAAARALPETTDARLSQTIAQADAAVTSAKASKDPLAALATLQTVNAQLDTVLESARAHNEQVQAAARSLDHALATARAEIAAANDYITTRRGGIGEAPRTRVSEAMRRLDAAVMLATSDPVKALAEARAASGLAHNALTSAQSEVQSIQSRSGYTGGGSDIGGAILGGIIGSMLGGGGSSGYSRPSSGTWGTSRTSWGSSSSSIGSRSGSFGGSSRRPTSSGSRDGRRSSGGRF